MLDMNNREQISVPPYCNRYRFKIQKHIIFYFGVIREWLMGYLVFPKYFLGLSSFAKGNTLLKKVEGT